MKSRLSETVIIEAVNRASSVLDVILIRPGWSLNNRFYPRDVLAAAAPKLEGVRAFANHPAKGDRPERCIFDQIGVYRGIHLAADGAIRGQLKLIGAASRIGPILDWAEESIRTHRPLIGLSINGVGRTEEGQAEGRRGTLVTAIDDFESVDVVTTAAAGGRFEALVASVGASRGARPPALPQPPAVSPPPTQGELLAAAAAAVRYLELDLLWRAADAPNAAAYREVLMGQPAR